MLPRLPTQKERSAGDEPLRLGGWGAQDRRKPAAAAAAAAATASDDMGDSDEEVTPLPEPERNEVEARSAEASSAPPAKPQKPLPEWRELGHNKDLPRGATRTSDGKTFGFKLGTSSTLRPPKPAQPQPRAWTRRTGPTVIVGSIKTLSTSAKEFVPEGGTWSQVATMRGTKPRDTFVQAAVRDATDAQQATRTLASERPVSVPACSFFVSGAGCRYGEDCRLRHPPSAVSIRSEVHSGSSAHIGTAQAFLSRGGALDALLPLVSNTEEGWEQVQAWKGAAAAGPEEDDEEDGEEEQVEEEEEERGDTKGATAPLSHDTHTSDAPAAPEETDEGEAEEVVVDLDDEVSKLAAAHGLSEEQLEAAEVAASETVACCVCMESPVSKQRAAGSSGWAGRSVGTGGSRFGLLSSCSHPVCLECIRKWRARKDVPPETARGCPLCRKRSHLVVPCDRLVTHPVRRGQVLAAYRRRLATIPCRAFDRGKGECPFGSSCFYEHRLADGTLAPKHPPRLYFDAEGGVSGRKGLTIADFV